MFKPVTYMTIRNYEVEWVYVSAENKSVKRVVEIRKGLHLSYASQLTACLELLMNVDGENGVGESELRVSDHTTVFKKNLNEELDKVARKNISRRKLAEKEKGERNKKRTTGGRIVQWVTAARP